MKLNFNDVMTILNGNTQFHGGYGPQGEPALTQGEKNQICGAITKKLSDCYDKNGDEFHSEVIAAIRRPLATNNWFARWGSDGKNVKRGDLIQPFVMIHNMYARASRTATIMTGVKQPKTIGEVVKSEMSEIFS